MRNGFEDLARFCSGTGDSDGDHLPLIDRVRAAVAGLSELEREILVRRYGLNGGPRELLHVIAGDHAEFTGERVRVIEARALRRLRESVNVSATK